MVDWTYAQTYGPSAGCTGSVPLSVVALMLRKYADRAPGCGYWAGDTLDMLKSGMRRAGVAVREK